ncbi:MAG TPA: hypothetical protein VN363_06225 [Anaerolineales bacterium]|nr:hypothetical protein [Anaerolineales bacterium]
MPELAWLPMVGVLIVIATCFTLLVSSSWQRSLAALAVQYLGQFILVSSVLPIELALVKLVSGLIAAAVLGMSLSGMLRRGELPSGSTPPDPGDSQIPDPSIANRRAASPQSLQSASGRIFRLLTGLLAALGGFSVAPLLVEWVPGMSSEQAWGSVILLGVGLLQLGFTVQPFRTILGLLTALSGFEIIYATAESSALVTGLLAFVTLGLSLAGAYLLLVASLEETA